MLNLLNSWSIAGILTLITGCLVYCYDVSPKFRYYFKFVVYIITTSTISLFVIPFAAFRPKDVRNTVLAAPALSTISSLLGIRWEIMGAEYLAKDYSCIITCNHQSIIDFLAMIALWPHMRKCAAVAKRDLLYIFPFGLMAWLCGTVFIDRSKPSESKNVISSSAERIHRNKIKMWIFPEGTRTKASSLKTFKKGAFHIALQNKLPILPIVISPYTFVNDEKKIFNPGRAVISILPPIDTDSYGPDDVNKLTELTHQMMNSEFQRLSLLTQKAENGSANSRNQTIFTLSLDALNAKN